MEPQQARRIWEEMIEEARSLAGERLPGEITIEEFSQKAGVPRNAAREYLETRVRKGILRKRKLYLPDVGSTCNLYSHTTE